MQQRARARGTYRMYMYVCTIRYTRRGARCSIGAYGARGAVRRSPRAPRRRAAAARRRRAAAPRGGPGAADDDDETL
jgi:hypothetical protein